MGIISNLFVFFFFVAASSGWLYINVPKNRPNNCGCQDDTFCGVVYINPRTVNQAERTLERIQVAESDVSLDVVFDELEGEQGAGISGTLVAKNGRPYTVEPCPKNTDNERQFHKMIRQHLMVQSDEPISDRTRSSCCGSATDCEKVEINKDIFDQSSRTGIYLETNSDPTNFFDILTADYFKFTQMQPNTNDKIYNNGKNKLTLAKTGGQLSSSVTNRYDEVLNSLEKCDDKGYFWKTFDESEYLAGARSSDGDRDIERDDVVPRADLVDDYPDNLLELLGPGGRAIQGADTCYYNTQKYCKPNPGTILNTTTIPLDDNSDTAAQNWCNTECNSIAGCKYFTWMKTRGIPTCYLLKTCSEDRADLCLGTVAGSPGQTCMSGPKDCEPLPNNTNCAPLIDHGPNYVTWQCTDYLGNPVDAYKLSTVPWGTICVQSCDSWRATGSNTTSPIEAHLKSICQVYGNWSNTVAYDGTYSLLYPSPTNNSVENTASLYPVPNDPKEVSLSCACETLELKWPTVPGFLNNPGGNYYDPNTEASTDFLCVYKIDLSADTFMIESNNTCTLFCDNLYKATVRCWDGNWSGQTDAGFFCKVAPGNNYGPDLLT